jgi:peroxiredoxin
MAPESTAPAGQRIGGTVPDFQLNHIAGGSHSLSELMRSRKGAVVVFWSGVCSHCVRYDRYFNDFQDRHPDVGFVTIASRQGETIDQVRAAVVERSLTFPILLDPNSQVAKQWATQQTPRAFLVDSSFRLLYRGAIDNFKYPNDSDHIAYLEPALADFMAGRPVARTETASFGCAIESVYYILPKTL